MHSCAQPAGKNRYDYFRSSFAKALEAAVQLDCKRLHLMFGHKVDGVAPEAQIDCALDHLAWAAPQAAQAGAALLTACKPWIQHIQIADVPGRHQPGTGEINYPNIFSSIEASGYKGYIGLEYRPEGSTAESLAWLPREKRDML